MSDGNRSETHWILFAVGVLLIGVAIWFATRGHALADVLAVAFLLAGLVLVLAAVFRDRLKELVFDLRKGKATFSLLEPEPRAREADSQLEAGAVRRIEEILP
jgi:hypothetical protein